MEKDRYKSLRSRPDIWADRFSGGASVNMRADDPLEGTMAIGGCVLFFILVPALVVAIFSVPFFFRLLDSNIENKSLLGAIVVASAAIVGGSLYQLRKYRRGTYALVELLFAVVTAWTAIAKLGTQGDLSVWLAFGGSAYLIVRGLDNLRVSREEVKKSEPLKDSNETIASQSQAQQIVGPERRDPASQVARLFQRFL